MKFPALRSVIFLSVVLCFAPPATRAQTTPLVPVKVWQALENEISGDIAFDHLRQLTLYHSPNGGSDDFRREAEWVAGKAREFGLRDVKILWMKAGSRGWNLRSGEAWVVEPEEVKLGDVRETPLRVATGSRTSDVTAELIDIGRGTRDADYEGKQVEGKIVLASGNAGAVHAQAVFQRGALGVISSGSRRSGFPDQLPWQGIRGRSRDGKEGTFAWILTPREGERLRSRLASARRSDEPLRVRVKIEVEFGQETQGIVQGWIRGTEVRNQAIVLTSHLQEEKTSANDDRSGVASMLEIARALVRLINEGKLARPRRDIRFWWVNEISAPYRYFGDHPDEAKRILVNLNQDMVGAKQSAGHRVQFMSQTPFSRPSFLNDVVESVLEAVRLGNTPVPLRAGADSGAFSRPMVSALGSQEPYRAAAVPFYSSTDHITFNDGRVGIPGISLTNWPDPYIHSSDDDLWQVDATQLKRNAFIIAASAYFIAAAGEPELPRLTGLLMGGAQRRLARDSATALIRLNDESAGDAGARYADAAMLLEAATRRELAAIDSARVFATPGGSGTRLLAAARKRIQQLADSLRTDLDAFYSESTGGNPHLNLSEEEQAAAARVPEWVVTLAQVLDGANVPRRVRGLHPHYSFEVRNLIDGKRSVLEIFRTVRAAALSAGEWYYGPVEFSQVTSLLERMEKAGAIRFK